MKYGILSHHFLALIYLAHILYKLDQRYGMNAQDIGTACDPIQTFKRP